MPPRLRNAYKTLRHISPEAARHAVLVCLRACQHTIAASTRAFGISRPTVYAILRKAQAGNLADIPCTPQHQPRRTRLSPSP